MTVSADSHVTVSAPYIHEKGELSIEAQTFIVPGCKSAF